MCVGVDDCCFLNRLSIEIVINELVKHSMVSQCKVV